MKGKIEAPLNRRTRSDCIIMSYLSQSNNPEIEQAYIQKNIVLPTTPGGNIVKYLNIMDVTLKNVGSN